MKPLAPPDSHYLSAAIGWLGLGNWHEAREELEQIAPGLRAHPDVLAVRYEIYSKAGKWDLAAEIARALVEIKPHEPQSWISHAYATRRMPGGGIPVAKEILSKAQPLFPKEPLIAFNLACYECQLGNLTAARKWLEAAFNLGDAKQVKLMALGDPDLAPLRKEISEY